MTEAIDLDDPEMARVAAAARIALTSQFAPSQTVTRAGTMLRMVHQGLRDMNESNEDRILLGFLGVVVFGRSMTLVMQNLRTHDQDAFNSWYAPWQAEMKDDALMRYFNALRTRIIHHDAPAIAIMRGGFGKNLPPIGSITVEGLGLPDRHLDEPLRSTLMVDLCRLYVDYLQRLFDSFAPVAFAVQDRLTAAGSNRQTDRA